MSIPFIHLRLHTEFSIEDSIISMDALIAQAKQLQFPALALTDRMNLFAGIKFYRAMMASGIKPIIGADIWIENEQDPKTPFCGTLLCQNKQGYYHLVELLSKAHEIKKGDRAILKKQWLHQKNQGLLFLSGGLHGEIGYKLIHNQKKEAIQCLKAWHSIFPKRFYIELQRMKKPQEEKYIQAVCQLAEQYQVPVVATQDIRFLRREDFEAHEARLCIQQGYTLNDTTRPKAYTAEQYIKSSLEMQQLFADIPSALQNSVEIAKRCNVELDMDQVHLPKFFVPEKTTVNDYLRQEALHGLTKRLASTQHAVALQSIGMQESISVEVYQKRLQSELQVIIDMGFASYFLIVADFIRWAKIQKIPVGPGRGSGAGSLVAYALQITDVDPLHYGLLFERFLNAERVSLPDFDIDFCMRNRDQVIDYVMQRYGKEAVAQIITFGTMAARAVIRDVGRVLGYPYGMVDSIAKLVPFEVGMTLEKALQHEPDAPYSLKARYNREEEVKWLVDLSQKLEGLVRNVGTHAGGIVIAPSRLTEFTALYYESEGTHAITQFDKDDLETIGLVKFDFLGLRTLTIIDWTVQSVNQKRIACNEPIIDVSLLPLNDAKTFTLLQSAKVMGVFQLESRGIQALLKRLAPDHFDDIVALIALFRPGPLQSGMVDDFIQRKHDPSQIRYLHPQLESILSATYGVILYQEQVMQIAQVLAGYSLGSADLLRRAMGKKKPAEMAKQRTFFIQGSEKNGIDKSFANTMFDLIEKFAGYGFNKSHSVAYALISYQTAWLKAHYPAEFMAAVMVSEMDNTDKVAALLYECRALKLTVKPPHIHTSQYGFSVNEKDEIEYGLGAIKGIGEAVVAHLVALQKKDGPFKDLFDLCQRVSLDKINRRALEALIYAGAFDVFQKSRAELIAYVPIGMQMAAQRTTAFLTKQGDLFGGVSQAQVVAVKPTEFTPWDSMKTLHKEKSVLGSYLSDHPLTYYQTELKHLQFLTLSHLSTMTQRNCLSLAWLVDIRIKLTLQKERFAILLLEDANARMELRLSPAQYQQYQELLVANTLLVIEVDRYSDKVTQESRFVIKSVWNIVGVRQKWNRYLQLSITAQWLQQKPESLNQLKTLLSADKGEGLPLKILYQTDKATVPLSVGEGWRVRPTDRLVEGLKGLLGKANVTFID